MPQRIDAKALDVAWANYHSAAAARVAAVRAIVETLHAGGNVAPVLSRYAEASHAVSEALEGDVRNAINGLFGVISMRLGDVEELSRGLQVEAGLGGRVAALETAVAALHLDVQRLADAHGE